MYDGVMIYRDDVSTLVYGQYIEKWSMVVIHNLLNGWGYIEGTYIIWTKIIEIDENHFQIRRDDDCYDLDAYACATQTSGELFLEHHITDLEVLVRCAKCVNEVVAPVVYDDERIEGLNDSEDERATTLADGFKVIYVKPVNDNVGLAGFLKCSNKKKWEDDGFKKKKHVDDSSNKNAAQDDGSKIKWRMMNMREALNKNFKFEWGMEFNSLDDFRDAIHEWSILNGREITFVKNESYRVRVECRAKCGFLILCSKVEHKHMCTIKTIHGSHTCARVLDSRSTNNRWVAKAVVKKMQKFESVRICDIIQYMRQNYSVVMNVAKAWKAKLIAKRIVEGDADKQYANLWRYAAELHRVNPGNTLKINVERPNPSIQPRFGSFYLSFDGCKQGFIKGCRPFVGVDGCHLKTKYGGQLLITVERNPNDQYFPLAFGVVETETKDS
ncbi:uncharacterized protein LOC131614273 [Vicia villosa]|uniref:uncharacterized protein LOC131614273 n=1 Tax=Vicia villosa TaxID=3911 RepID=UPI00273A9280|nr:uncharacterized protein LOC131614273 [Vicia villosa]